MVIVSIVFGLLLIISLVYHVIYRRQVERLGRQIAFLNENKYEMKITTDIGTVELKELAEQIQKLNDRLKNTEKTYAKQDAALRETITNLSHDIRTPLTSLDGYFQLLAATNIDQEKRSTT